MLDLIHLPLVRILHEIVVVRHDGGLGFGSRFQISR